jgi:hypothetical protein
MTRLAEQRSVIAIDPTTRGLAYAFFEGGELMDWGNTAKGEEKDERALLDRLIDGCAADILVIEDPDDDGCRRRPRIRALLRALRQHALKRGLAVVRVPREGVRKAWIARGHKAKDAIAAEVVKLFRELAPILPRPREPYMTEDARIQIFDAVTLALHAFGGPPREEPSSADELAL